LFILKIVDNYGLNDQESLFDNDTPLELHERQTLGIIWNEEMYDSCYDDQKEKEFEIHESARKTLDKESDDSVPLSTCLDLFTEVEKLGPEDAWYCGHCKDHVQATKKFDLWKLPQILVVHLKRFSYKKRYYYGREKLDTFVDYPIYDLDLTPYVKGPQEVPPLYDLYAVSNHFGSLGGGHYTAYAKNFKDSKWYKFDDSSVSKVEESKVKTAAAYVLFYRRKDTYATNTNASVTPNAANTSAEPMDTNQVQANLEKVDTMEEI